MTNKVPLNSDIQAFHETLCISSTYSENCSLDFCPDCPQQDLVKTELDVFGRQPLLEKNTFSAWQAMQNSAAQEAIQLQIVSAFRSAEYQMALLQRKLERGETIKQILQVNAAPGFSEHHSGCAIDISTPGFEPLELEFDNSPAFTWLCQHAAKFGFSMSFPRNNTAGIAYEPWHWKYTSTLKE